MNFEYILSTWTRLNEFLRNSTESECEELFNYEAKNRKRYAFLMRIVRRRNKLRAFRERKELLIYKGAKIR